MQRDPFADFFGNDPFDDPLFSGFPRGRGRNQGVCHDFYVFSERNALIWPFQLLGNGDIGGMMQSMRAGGNGGSMVVMSSSFSSNGREVHSSTTSARMGPGGVAEIQSQVRS